jgi:hypothetical protein
LHRNPIIVHQEESSMLTKDQFGAELKKRFEELAAWAVANSPDSNAPLQSQDFEICRNEIAKLSVRDDIGERNAALPEPSEAGPQYVSVTPAPWP